MVEKSNVRIIQNRPEGQNDIATVQGFMIRCPKCGKESFYKRFLRGKLLCGHCKKFFYNE